ncbi:hypothetical protein [Halohasta litorea]|uniref:Uncharacterized protein n=1 Tax=Halohasta litorea TaxID=869891 RepID=A0ABD6DCB0_9EURY|nr:hypothetical protein [Halohasta litorea]MEA1930436.1 hypothetical protein [Euryarchaeota archaeon]
MVEVEGYEIIITSILILLIGTVLSYTGYLQESLSLFMFMAMGLVGFLAVRAIRGRKFDWR